MRSSSTKRSSGRQDAERGHAKVSERRQQKAKLGYYAVQQVGVRGSGGVRRGLHLPSQVAGAVQGIRGGPAEEGFLPVEEDELQGEVGAGRLQRQIGGVSFSPSGAPEMAFI